MSKETSKRVESNCFREMGIECMEEKCQFSKKVHRSIWLWNSLTVWHWCGTFLKEQLGQEPEVERAAWWQGDRQCRGSLSCQQRCCWAAQSCPTLCSRARLLCPWASPGKNTGGHCHLLQGIFQTQGLNLLLLNCRQILYHLSLQGNLSTLTNYFFCRDWE